MSSDPEYDALVRSEALARVDAMLAAVQASPQEGEAERTRWRAVWRNAHSLAGLGRELDEGLARRARRVAERLMDPEGRPHAPTADEAEALRREVERIRAILRSHT